MKKVLRSLIHEKFCYDLRVELDFLSMRRDIDNEEKQEELFNLLRKYNIDGAVPLGSGTNRYAFKLDGFVIKFATDHEGKIDNAKEFKMARVLFPYVTKVYEVSANGTILVAEYVVPFENKWEMLEHEKKIIKILSDISSNYLIGDVGIHENNFGNWGKRIGSDEPVCLDSAYVIGVSSELLVCRKCNTGSMLIPSKDFYCLHCSNPGCGEVVLFETLRGKISEEDYLKEIGDLKKEGYVLRESGVEVELDEKISSYVKPISKKKSRNIITQPEPEDLEPDFFEMEHPPSYYLKGGQ